MRLLLWILGIRIVDKGGFRYVHVPMRWPTRNPRWAKRLADKKVRLDG